MMTKMLCSWLALVWTVVSVNASARLTITGLTIKLASSAQKDALTFAGSYPSAVLNKQELAGDTEITVSFSVASDDDSSVNIIPQQHSLMFQSKSIDVATYIKAKPKEEKFIEKIDVRSLVQQLGSQDLLELSVIVGDPKFSEGVVWNLGSLTMRPRLEKDMGVETPMLPRRLHERTRLPEIEHQFRPPEPRPPVLVSILFAVLSLFPLLLWLRCILVLPLNRSGLPSPSSIIWVMLFHGGLGAMLLLFVLFFLGLNLVQLALPLTCLSVFCFLTGHQALCAANGTHVKEKSA